MRRFLSCFLVAVALAGCKETPHKPRFVTNDGEEIADVVVTRYESWRDLELALAPEELMPIGTLMIERVVKPIRRAGLKDREGVVVMSAESYATLQLGRSTYLHASEIRLNPATQITVSCDSCERGAYVAINSGGVYHWQQLGVSGVATFNSIDRGKIWAHAVSSSLGLLTPVFTFDAEPGGEYVLKAQLEP